LVEPRGGNKKGSNGQKLVGERGQKKGLRPEKNPRTTTPPHPSKRSARYNGCGGDSHTVGKSKRRKTNHGKCFFAESRKEVKTKNVQKKHQKTNWQTLGQSKKKKG